MVLFDKLKKEIGMSNKTNVIDIDDEYDNSINVNEKTKDIGEGILEIKNSTLDGKMDNSIFFQKPIEEEMKDKEAEENKTISNNKEEKTGEKAIKDRDNILKPKKKNFTGEEILVKKISDRSKAEKVVEKKLNNVLIDKHYVDRFLMPRTKETHKGSCGRVLIVAGVANMPGAAIMAAKAALRAGSGLVFVATKQNNFTAIQSAVPEVICITVEDILHKIDDFDAVAIGPGMGTTMSTAMILENILKVYGKPLIIDADALNSLAKTQPLWPVMHKTKAETIITPHLVEAARLLQRNSASYEDRPLVARQLFMKFGAVTVVKGHRTIVYNGKDIFLENTTGNPGMATAGSGDVLTGIITSFAGQGLSAEDATSAGVYVHGRAGDLASEEIGEYGVISSDIISKIPFAIREIVGK